jgi:hypothetical protein
MGLFAKASANLNQTDKDKALEMLQEQVDDNKVSFDAALNAAKKKVNASLRTIAALDCNPNATAEQIINAKRASVIAQKDVDAIIAIIADRFAE